MEKVVLEVKNLSKFFHIGAYDPNENIKEYIAKLPKKIWKAITRDLSDYPVHWALKDINFSVREGECVALMGVNGSGKSTLLKILSRIYDPSGGEAIIYGRVNSLLEVGTGFHTDLTGRDNIYLNGAILGMKRAEINHFFEDIVDYAGIREFLETPVKYYSSGMQVRLAFAVAAHLDPEVLFLDEVLAVGDEFFQKKCLETLSKLKARKKTIFFVSHDASNVEFLCERTLLISKGKIVFDGPTPEALVKYRELLAQSSDQ